MMYLKGHGKSNSRTNKKQLSRMNVQEHICRFFFIYRLDKFHFYQPLCLLRHLSINVHYYTLSGILIFFFLLNVKLQAFIDKFRYNAKRASLVQSRIKVIYDFCSARAPFMISKASSMFQIPTRSFHAYYHGVVTLPVSFHFLLLKLIILFTILSFVSSRH